MSEPPGDNVRRVRLADAARDAQRIAEIYRPYVTDTIISFEELAPDAAEMSQRMTKVLAWAPWLVAEDLSGRVIGYAYGARHRERAGYRWSVDISVYVDAALQRRGVGRALYGELIPILRRQRFVNAYAGIGLPNPASVAIHQAIGMRLIGTYEKVGWKLGRWVDVAWYGMGLTEPPLDGAPPEPIPFCELAEP
jgi:L-amino acid N-acyltransferase YncA